MFTPVAASRLEVSDSSSISLDHYSCSNAKIFSDSGSKVRQLALFLKVLISRAWSAREINTFRKNIQSIAKAI
jgi:hypothetical protein